MQKKVAINLAILFLLTNPAGAQKRLQGVSLALSCGSKLSLNQSELPEFPKAFRVNTSLLMAGELSVNGFPLSLFYSFDYFIALQSSSSQNTSISHIYEKYTGNLLAIRYNHNNMYFGLGHYWQHAENWGKYQFPYSTFKKTKNITGIIGFRNNGLEIDYQPSVAYSPLFGGIDLEIHSINARFLLSKPKATPAKSDNRLLFYLTGRLFILQREQLTGEDFAKIGVSPGLGIAFCFPKINSCLFAERDFWVALNGGSFERPVKGFISNSIVGIKYKCRVAEDKYIQSGLGMAYITDQMTQYRTRELISQGKANRRLWYYNIKGVSISLEYMTNERMALQCRHIIPFTGESKYQPERTSVGINYYLNN